VGADLDLDGSVAAGGVDELPDGPAGLVFDPEAESRFNPPPSRSPVLKTSRILAHLAGGHAAKRWTGTPIIRLINKAGTAAGLSHIHPHRLRHTLATPATAA